MQRFYPNTLHFYNVVRFNLQKLTNENPHEANIAFTVHDDSGERIWEVTFAENENQFTNIHLSQLDKSGELIWAIDCSKGEFTKENGWKFVNGKYTEYPKNSFAKAPVQFNERVEKDMKDDPVMMRNYRSLSGLSLGEISKRKNSSVKFSEEDVYIMDTKFYSLIFGPFACMISVLIGIPLSITPKRQGSALTSAAKAIGIMIGYYLLMQIFMNFGNSGILPAFIAGSAPTLAFLGFGIYVSLKK